MKKEFRSNSVRSAGRNVLIRYLYYNNTILAHLHKQYYVALMPIVLFWHICEKLDYDLKIGYLVMV